jgi:tRNA dimethylallyltransferase
VKVIILTGPTGVGKTDIAIKLAQLLNTEIISSDSMQIYRYMDIGTAKPNLEQRQAVKHHMIDIVNPWEYFSTGNYIEQTRKIIDKLIKQGKIPLIVGGTGLYIRAITEGIFKGPDADWDLRRELLNIENTKAGSLYSLLEKVDPLTAEKINPSDIRRIIRALEVFYKEGRSITELQMKTTKPLPYEFLKICIKRNREELYRMIEQRVDIMIASGLIEEVRKVFNMIRKNYKEDIPLPALQAIGYKEIGGYLADFYSLQEAIRLIKKRTKMYAKRQFTWFNKEKDIIWVDITGVFNSEETAKKIFDIIANNINLEKSK